MKKPYLTLAKKNLFGAITFAILAVICFINFKTLWKTGLICVFLSVTYYMLYLKRKAKENEMDKIMGDMADFLEEDDDEKPKKKTSKMASKEMEKRKKAEYDSYIAKINEEFDFDIEDYEDGDD